MEYNEDGIVHIYVKEICFTSLNIDTRKEIEAINIF